MSFTATPVDNSYIADRVEAKERVTYVNTNNFAGGTYTPRFIHNPDRVTGDILSYTISNGVITVKTDQNGSGDFDVFGKG